MDLSSKEIIAVFCKKYHIKLSRQHGQSFLIAKDVVRTIARAANLKPADVVLEVGPGFGVITQELAKGGSKILAVEIDKKFVSLLKNFFADNHRVEIIKDDILQANLSNLGLEDLNYKVVANLPYNITSHFIRQRLTQSPRPKLMVLVVQQEVAERICANSGEMSLLSVSVQFYAQPTLIEMVSRTSFWPEPEVDAAIVKFEKIGEQRNTWVARSFNDKKLFQLVRIGFSARRKMLKNNLAAGLGVSDDNIEQVLEKAGLDKKIRAQEMSVGEWIKLGQLLNT